MRFWRMHQLWELAEGLPVKRIRLNELDGFDEVRWFGGRGIFSRPAEPSPSTPEISVPLT